MRLRRKCRLTLMSIADCYSGLGLQRRQKIVDRHTVAVIGVNVAGLDEAVRADHEGAGIGSIQDSLPW